MVTAREPGTCVVCTAPYAPQDELGLVLEGWAHLECWGWVTEEGSMRYAHEVTLGQLNDAQLVVVVRQGLEQHDAELVHAALECMTPAAALIVGRIAARAAGATP